ncbi:hypothetical protein PHISCL_07911 [Aspergillus sclerotialis]|uniref:Uncharacterized protein n=1 Tax=Aspergillus sclerotialis TaxID=2070753 RepID=A0A3A2ZPD7_9EURO|nr:hypothetical protein PHISCL_07911 [Aspergillus sclerotialis]
MDESVAEGISTSLQTCSPTLQSYDFEGNFEFDPLPSSPPSFLHVNDLGLTLSPGSQLEQATGVTQDRNEICQVNENSDVEGKVVTKHSDLPDVPRQFRDGEDTFLEGTANSAFTDILLDPELARQLFEPSFVPRKRAGDEAFSAEVDLQAPPEKRRVVEPPETETVTPPINTPSLASPNSSHQTDQAEITPNTPEEPERSQTPDSLFDSLDSHFEDLSGPSPAGDVAPSNTTAGTLSNTKDTEGSFAPAHDVADPGNVHETTPGVLDTVHRLSLGTPHHQPGDSSTYASDVTKQRFSLNDQDVIANMNREMLKRVDPQVEYVSPYPVYGGPLGYLPSSPGVHVKCIEVANGHISDRMNNLKSKVQKLTHERDKYKSSLLDCTTVDPDTGKPMPQLLREQNATLRRLSSHNKTRGKMYKEEMEEWKNRFYSLAMTYNNLLREFQSQQRPLTIAPTPTGCFPPICAENVVQQLPVQNEVTSYSGLNQQTSSERPSPYPVNNVATGTPRANHPNSQPTVRPQEAPSKADTVMIDLTDETTGNAPESSRSPAISPRGAELLRSFQNKKYSWLENNNNQGQTSHQGPSGNQVPSHRGITSREHRESMDAPTVNSTGQGNTAGTDSQGEIGVEDDFAREMERELARV